MLSVALPPVLHGLLVGTAVIWVAGELRQGIKRRPEGLKADWGSEIIFRLGVLVGALAATGLAHATPSVVIRPTSVADGVGLGLLWCGIGLRFWSFRTLGRYFTFVVQTSGDQPVISDGPYGVVRHPSYAGILLAIMGVGLFIGNWWSLVLLTVVVAAALVFRIRVEERALLKSLGDNYAHYAVGHKRLIPFVW
jgi:protein-S-isoprenylcysteine O-methyltransferase Ste14